MSRRRPGDTGAARPPRLATWIATRLLRPDDATRLLGDLDEEYTELQRPGDGRLTADLWYWRQLIASVRALRRGARAAAFGSVLASTLQDARYALRQLRRRPGLTVAATLTLSLGIGATTAVFSVVDRVLLQPPPYAEPDRLIRAWAHADDGDTTFFSFRVAEYRELATRTDTFAAVGAEFPASLTAVFPDGEPHQVTARMITADWFDVFGVRPQLGRMFGPEEIAAGDALVVVVTHEFWQRWLGADPSAVGRTLELNGNDFEVVGVLPDSYEHVLAPEVEAFIPYTLGTSRWIGHWLEVYARVQPGITLQVAEQRINAVLDAVAERDARSRGWFATVEGLHEMLVGDIRLAVWATFGTVLLVLLIACVNVANLVMAAMTTRGPEFRLRAALGAGRGRLVRQVFLESVALALVGGALGVGLAPLALSVIVSLAPAGTFGVGSATVDGRVLAAAVSVTFATAMTLGALAALAGAGDRTARRRAAPAGTPVRRLNAFVVAQVALALTLVTSAGLLVRTFQELQREDLGFHRGGTLTFRLVVPSARYPTSVDTAAYYESLREALSTLPGVTAVGAGTDLPVSGEGAVALITSEARFRAGDAEPVTALQRRATAGFFESLGVPVLAGREFGADDRGDSETVAVISDSLARALFGDEPAVGKRIAFPGDARDEEWMRVVGRVGDVRFRSPDREGGPQIYQAHPQSASREMALVVRTSGDPELLVGAVREVVRRLDPKIPIYSIATLDRIVATSLGQRRFAMTLFSLFAAIAVILALAGIYGVLAFVVGQRRRELGVRVALGASAAAVRRHVVARGMRPVLAGLVLGAAGAHLAARLIGTLLYNVTASDPLTYTLGASVVAVVGLVVCLIPARRAARLDPVHALRSE